MTVGPRRLLRARNPQILDNGGVLSGFGPNHRVSQGRNDVKPTFPTPDFFKFFPYKSLDKCNLFGYITIIF